MKKFNKTIRILISVILSLVFITQMTSYAFAQDVETYIEEPSANMQEEIQDTYEIIDTENVEEAQTDKPEKAHIETEMSSKRDIYVKHFKLSDGSMAAMQYEIPVHFKNSNGKFIEYDNRLIEDKDASNFKGSDKEDFRDSDVASQTESDEKFEIIQEPKTNDEMEFVSEYSSSTKTESESENTTITNDDLATEHDFEEKSTSTDMSNDSKYDANPKSMENTYYYKVKQSDKYMAVASTVKEGDTVRLSKDGYAVSWGLTNGRESNVKIVEKEAKLDGDDAFTVLPNITQEVKYEKVFEDADLQYIITPVGVKENIILNSLRAKNQYEILYDIGSLHAKQKDEHTIDFLNENNEVIYQISAPVMTDQNGESSTSITLEIISEEEGVLRLLISADEKWLKDEARKYPVTIDPYFYSDVNASTISCVYVASNKPNVNYHNETYVYVGHDTSDVNKGTMRTYLKLRELPDLGDECELTNVTISLMTQSNATTPIAAHEVTSDWDYNTITWSSSIPFESNLFDFSKKALQLNNELSGLYQRDWDITAQAKKWVQNPSSNKGIVLKFIEESTSNTMIRFYSSAIYNNYVIKPIARFIYRNFAGLESYWSYHSVSAGVNGSANIQDFTGNLVVTENILSEGGTRLPISISMVYNTVCRSNNKVLGTNFISKGWKPDFYMTLTPTDDESFTVDGYDYVYLDGDGTKHYFKLKPNSTSAYEDEDGLGLTLQPATAGNNFKHTVTDRNGTTYKFKNGGGGIIEEICDAYGNKITYSSTLSNSKYRVNSITDGAGRITTINYVSPTSANLKLSSITRPDGKNITFTYGTDNLADYITKITYPDGQKVEFAYANSDYSMSEVITNSNRKLKFQYGAHKVTKMTEAVSTDGSTYTNGDYINASYDEVFCSRFNDRKNRHEIVQFDSFGRTTGIVDDQGNIINSAYNDTNSSQNKLSLLGSSQAYVKNYINDPNVENTSAAYGASYWNSSSAGFLGVCSDTSLVDNESQQFLGSKSLKISHTDTDQYFTTMQQNIINTSLNGKEISISAYIKTSNIVRTSPTNNTTGAFIRVRFYNADNVASDADSIFLTGTNKWQRIGFTTTVPADTVNFKVHFGIRNAQGTAWFDCIQVEEGSGINDCNLIKNSDCSSLNSWSFLGTGTPSASSNGIFVEGNIDNHIYVYQDVNIKKAGVAFNLFAEVQASSAPLIYHMYDDATAFELRASIVYNDNSTELKVQSFNPFVTSDQTLSFAIKPTDPTRVIKQITFEIRYAHNINSFILKKAMLTMDESGESYTYDDDGNLITAKDNANRNQSYSYSNANELTNYTNQNSDSYTYKYDSTNPHKLTKAYSNQRHIGFCYDYDSYGNVTNVRYGKFSSDGNTFYTSSSYNVINQSTTYTTDGNNVASVTAPDGGVTSYNVNNVKSLLNSVTDPLGNTTSYTYDSNNYQLKTVTNDSKTLSYSYSDSDKKLTKITYGGMNYSFAYDKWDNITTIDVNTGGNSYNYTDLITNTYDSYGDNLTKVKYANNQANSYTYDNYDRVKKTTFVDTNNSQQVVSEYKYNNRGDISNIKDNRNNYTKTYIYDLIGRPTSVSAKGGDIDYRFNTCYNAVDDVTSYDNVVDGVHNITTYEYTSDSLPSKTRNDAFSVTYTYDRIGRISDITRQSAGGTSGKTYTYVRPYDTDTESSFKWRSTLQIKSERVGNEYYDYFYDANGNLSVIGKKTGSSNDYNFAESYQYDSLNRISAATYLDMSNSIATTYSYTYDSRGNVTKCNKSTLNLSTFTSTDTDIANFTYNSVWKDLIATYNGTTITYDNSGNPLTYRDGMSMTWKNGNELTTLAKGSTNVSYKYDDSSLRTKKTVNSTVHNYEYVDGNLMYEEIGSNKLYFSYDVFGNPFSLNYNGTYYYYDLNWRGDVIALIGTDNNLKARYEYDEWGKLLGIYDANNNLITGSTHIGVINPLRYRGYYYDTESELYYLGSRYYDPKTYRFINADDLVCLGAGKAMNCYNLYSYCENNPVMYVDSEGTFINAIIGGVIGGIAGGITAALNGDNIWAGIGVGAGTGALAGLAVDAAIATGGVAAIVIAGAGGAIASGINYGATELVNDREIDWGEMAIEATVGGVTNILAFGVGGGSIKKTGGNIIKKMASNAKKAVMTNTTRKVAGKIVKKTTKGIVKNVFKNLWKETRMAATIWACTTYSTKRIGYAK